MGIFFSSLEDTEEIRYRLIYNSGAGAEDIRFYFLIDFKGLFVFLPSRNKQEMALGTLSALTLEIDMNLNVTIF